MSCRNITKINIIHLPATVLVDRALEKWKTETSIILEKTIFSSFSKHKIKIFSAYTTAAHNIIKAKACIACKRESVGETTK